MGSGLPGVAIIGSSVAGDVRVTVTPPRPTPTFRSWRKALEWCREQGLSVFNDEAAEQMADVEEA